MDDLRLPKLPEPCIRPFPGADPYYFAEEQLRAAQLDAWRAAVDACARKCLTHGGRMNPASENAERYAIQDEWGRVLAASLRSMPLPKGE